MMKSVVVLLAGLVAAQEYDSKEIERQIKEMDLTCSSSLRLQNAYSKYYLSSMNLGYGSGSG